METVQVTHEKSNGRITFRSLQARLDELETNARERLLRALGAGQHRLTELDGKLERMAHEDWSVEGMRRRLDTLRKQADALRATALKRVNEIPATAVKGLAEHTRVPVQNLARELDRLARMVEPKPVTVTTAEQVEIIPPPEPRPSRSKQKAEV